MKQKVIHVFLGRFSPIHKGHQRIIDKLVTKFGIKNCLVIIGSSTSLNQRTPFTFEARREMIRTLYPNIRIVGISDINPKLEMYDPTNLVIWLNKLKSIEKKLKNKFIFYGGSREDIQHLRKKFEGNVLVNRFKGGLDISATKIRNALANKEHIKLHGLLDERIIDQAIVEFNRF